MADQTDQNYQPPVYPQNSLPDQGVPPAPDGIFTQVTEIPVYEPPVEPPTEELSTVAVASQNGVPKWFYFLFGITLIIFFIVTALLVANYTQKKSIFQLLGIGQGTQTSIPTIPSAPSPVVINEFLPSITPTVPATPAADLKLPGLTTTDEVSDLEKDISGTDFTQLDKAISNLDREAGTSGVTP